uniref:Uncharacterized protein n=1 Tax=Tanacetum cinerariifolium TaxID=118510 RepID=A0A6L2LS09_TANCI|nr:hypothetical protein [Tanacetum cinerariifolium]
MGAESLRWMKQEEAKVEDCNKGDMNDIWDIALEDVPFIPQTIHTTPPDKDYVAPATKSIMDELLEEFKDKILDITVNDGETDFNPTRDIKELERLRTKDTQSHFTKKKVHKESELFIHTQQLCPLWSDQVV